MISLGINFAAYHNENKKDMTSPMVGIPYIPAMNIVGRPSPDSAAGKRKALKTVKSPNGVAIKKEIRMLCLLALFKFTVVMMFVQNL